jgi:hypothetical protein
LNGNSNTIGSIITTGGNVGVGTVTPSYKLHVSGDIYSSGDITAFSDIRLKENIVQLSGCLDKIDNMRGVSFNRIDTGTKHIGLIAQEVEAQFPELVATDQNNGLKSVNYGNVVAVLLECIRELKGEVFNSTNSTITNAVNTTLTSGAMVITGGSLNATFNSNTLGNIFTTGGNVGIGTTSPAYRLQLSSDSAAKPSTNTWTVSSDERLKTNIQLADLDMCYNIIKSIPLKKYTWRDDIYTAEQVPDRSKLGWIAQDVEQVIPKAVEQREMFGYTDCRTLNSDQLIASLYGTVQKLMMTVEQLQDEIEILKGGEKLFT